MQKRKNSGTKKLDYKTKTKTKIMKIRKQEIDRGEEKREDWIKEKY